MSVAFGFVHQCKMLLSIILVKTKQWYWIMDWFFMMLLKIVLASVSINLTMFYTLKVYSFVSQQWTGQEMRRGSIYLLCKRYY